jgi:hypothetical protein
MYWLIKATKKTDVPHEYVELENQCSTVHQTENIHMPKESLRLVVCVCLAMVMVQNLML